MKTYTTKKEKFFKTYKTGFSTTLISFSGYGYGRHAAGMVNIYGFDNEGIRFDYVVTHHRSKVIASMIEAGTWWKLDSAIRSNYSTNGYNTRKGIKNANLTRCKQLQNSHTTVPFSGKSAHDYRVLIRN